MSSTGIVEVVAGKSRGGCRARRECRRGSSKRRLRVVSCRGDRPGGFIDYTPQLGSTMTNRANAIRDVMLALEEFRIDAYYQPIFRIGSRAIVGLEALCRLIVPDGEAASATSFHEATSDVRIASKLTRRMMAIAAADVREWLCWGQQPEASSGPLRKLAFRRMTPKHMLKVYGAAARSSLQEFRMPTEPRSSPFLIAPLLMFRHGELHGRNLDGNRSTPRRSHIPPMKSARNVRSTEQTSPLSLTRKPGEIPGLSLGLFAYQRRP